MGELGKTSASILCCIGTTRYPYISPSSASISPARDAAGFYTVQACATNFTHHWVF